MHEVPLDDRGRLPRNYTGKPVAHSLVTHHWQIAKQVNDGQWLSMGTAGSKDDAVDKAEKLLAFHLERCPKDRVEMMVSTPWEVVRIHNGDTV